MKLHDTHASAGTLPRQHAKRTIGSALHCRQSKPQMIRQAWQGIVGASVIAGAITPTLALASPTKDLPAYCARVGPPSTSLPGASTAIYRTVGDRALRIHIFAPRTKAKRNPAAIFFFGGGFRTGDVTAFAEIAKAFAARGYVAAIADYRILCRDGVTAVGGVDDAQAALAWVRAHASELQIDRKRIALVGGSAGGLLSASAGMRVPVGEQPAALVLFNPVLDLGTGIPAQDQSAAEAAAYSPSRLPLTKLPPAIVFHGTADRTVPIASSQDFCARAKKSGRICQLVEYKGMDHGFYNKQGVDPALGVSPFEDTMKRTFQFLGPIMNPLLKRP